MSNTSVERAISILQVGGLVAIPTETVYGLAADATNELAVRRIFAAKGRPVNHPLIVHIGSADQLTEWATNIPTDAWKLAERFWPGPLTMILPRGNKAADAVTGGLPTIGLRVPRHALTLELLKSWGGGVAAPSANRFGKVSPTTAQHVAAELETHVDLILNGGACEVGVESTIIDLSSKVPCILRPGAISVQQIEHVLGYSLGNPNENTTQCAGRLESHYAPRAGIEIVEKRQLAARIAQLQSSGVKVAVLSDEKPVENVIFLLLPSQPESCAQRLYAALHEVDTLSIDIALVVPPPAIGIGVAVLDRLAKAAHREKK